MKNGIFPLVIAGALLSHAVSAQEDTSRFYVGAGYGILSVPDEDDAKFSDANNGSIQFGYKITENFAIEAQYSKSLKSASGKAVFEGLDISDAWWQSTLALNPGATLNDVRQWFPFAYADATLDIDAKIQTTALYGVYRTSGDFYVKAKAGYLSTKAKLSGKIKSADIHVAVSGNQPIDYTINRDDDYFDELGFGKAVTISDSDSDFSAGLGVGYKFNQSLFSELEYTKVNDDLDFYSLSINYAF